MRCNFNKDTFRGLVLGAAGMFVVAAAVLSPRLWSPAAQNSSSEGEVAAMLHPGEQVVSGPWGRVEALRIPMVNAGGSISDAEQRLTEPKWCFENVSEPALRSFLATTDLAPWQRKAFLDKQYWTAESNGWVIHPPDLLVASLEPQVRARIYSFLAKNKRNYSQARPFRFPEAGFKPCLAMAGLPAASVDKLQRLTWHDSGSICFSDLHVAKETLPPDQFEELVEVLYQLPAYRLRLRILPGTDVEPLVQYWGRGGREKLIRPLLKSMSLVPGGASMALSKLLPPYARVRLNTYPAAWDNEAVAQEDCFYTGLNFFSSTPNTNFSDRAVVERTLKTGYAPITGEPAFGDLMLLMDASGQAFHCCVYLAGDFVYTKNGVDPNQPWVFMRINDMLLTYYGGAKPSGTVLVRRKQDSIAGFNNASTPGF